MPGTAPVPSTVAPFGTHAPTAVQRALMRIGQRLRRGWLGQRLGTAIRFAMRKSAGTRPLDVVVLGQKMRLHLSDNAADRRLAATPQFFDPEEMKELRRVAQPNLQFVDLGANIGTYTLFAAQLAGNDEAARVLAIEPNPAALARLSVNIALNGFRVIVAPVAVSDSEGELDIKVDDRNLGAATLHDVYKGAGLPRQQMVRTRPLLDIVTEAGFVRIDVIKADIEGFEDRALLPFFRAAPTDLWPELMIIEDSSDRWREDLLQELTARGYRCSFRRKNLVLRRGA
jgi:FkbM family methyltransferase